MNAYEKMLKIIREQSAKSTSSSPLRLAEMQTSTSCTIGSLPLDAEDLLIAEHLKGKLKKGDAVLVQKVSSDHYVILAKVVSM